MRLVSFSPKVSRPHVMFSSKRPDVLNSLQIGAAAVTLPVLCSALYVIVSPKYGDADKKWAYGAVGTLLGFWLGAS